MPSNCDDLTTLFDAANDRMQAVTQSMIDGNASVGQWQESLWVEIRRAHTQSGAAGKGAWDTMTQADWRRVGGRLSREAGWLRDFAKQVAGGDLSEAQIQARVGQYSHHLQQACWDGATSAAQEDGAQGESRHLQPGESCPDCVGYQGQGIVPIGTLPEPGSASVCRANCNCVKRYWHFNPDGSFTEGQTGFTVGAGVLLTLEIARRLFETEEGQTERGENGI